MLLFLLMACPNHDDPIVVELSPDIDVSPEELVFGDRGVPTRTDLKVLISNEGRADLSAALEITGEGAGAYALSDREIELPPPSGGERSEIEVTVTFAPTTYLDYPADLVITSNDTNAPELHVPIAGAGVSAPLPDIYLDAATLDFGDVDAHTERILWLGNGGTADLHVGTLTLEGSGAFSLIADPSLQTLAPGARFPILVGYDPDGQGQNGVVVVPSDDPDEPELRATLLGNGGGDFEYPEAVITCPSQVDPPRLVSLDGFGSSDPGGYEPLAYAWSLARVPTNGAGQPISSAFLSSLAGPTTVLAVDAVGTYEVQLRVTNTQDTVSAPASCVIQAIPDEELVVELTWDTPNADVDLHLALADTPVFDAPGDACWCNPSPDWSGQGNGADDPERNLDDRAGYGPENIAILTPADGSYDVRVHYYDDHGDGTVAATVRVYVRGSLTPVYERSRLLDRDQVWYAGRINWPAGTVGDPSAELVTAATRQCF